MFRYAAGAVVAGIGLVIIGPWISRLLLADEGAVPRGLLIWLAVLGVVWSVELALTSSLTSGRAMRPVTVVTVLGLLVNVVLSFVLVVSLGTNGPIIASVLAISMTVVTLTVVVRAEPSMLEMVRPE